MKDIGCGRRDTESFARRNDPDRRSVLAAGLAASGLLVPAPGAAAAARIDALIERMTPEEKAGQLSCFNDEVRPVGAVLNPRVNARGADAMLADVRAGRVGMLFNGWGVAGARRAQAAALDSRLGIPLAFAADVIHGARTVFPVPLAEAAAFDPALSERAARAVAREATAGGLHWTFAPMVDVARDQRWGRVVEGAGEDVHLNGVLAAARVRGFQGPDLRRADAMLATPKHFVGYGAVAGGMEYGPVDMSEDTLRQVFLPPFAAAFGAGAGATMASFTTFNGVPVAANRWLLTRVLREEMGFSGVCVSDYDADRELIAHGVAADEADAARLAILAGVDVSMQSGLYNRHLPALMAAGAVPVAAVDRSVRRVLALKEALGLFDDPYRSLSLRAERRAADRRPARRLAGEVARAAPVLLRNEGLLPLPRGGARLALIGPFAADRTNLNGPWSFAGDPAGGIDLAAGVASRMAAPSLLTVEPGSGINAPLPGGIDRAVAAARAADAVLLALGEGADWSGEGNSRASIALPPAQRALADAVAAAGRPVAVLLRHGRALALDGAVRDAAAILCCWFLGEETGPAVADILFGLAEPVGRLPVSFPHATGQQPWSYDRLPTGRPAPADDPLMPGRARWRDAPDAALYPFGWGLSYTRFALAGIALPDRIALGAGLIVDATVANVGARMGTAMVRVDVRPHLSSRSMPRRMRAFARVTITPGGRATVPLTLARETFPTPGRYDLSLSAQSGEEVHRELTVGD